MILIILLCLGTFATQLALGLAAKNEDDMIGLLDVDICGPSIPTILGLERYNIRL